MNSSIYNNFSVEDLSLLAGRLSAPNAPPKDASELAAHIELIKEQRRHERRLIELEAKDIKRKREESERDTKQWELLLGSLNQGASFREKLHYDKATTALWRRGLPPQVRARVWELALNNPHGIDSAMHELCVAKARRRAGEIAITSLKISKSTNSPTSNETNTLHVEDRFDSVSAPIAADDIYSPWLSSSGVSSNTVPEETSLKQAFSREACKLQRRYTNNHLTNVVKAAGLLSSHHHLSHFSCEGSLGESEADLVQGDASLALGTLSEDGATLKEDNEDGDEGRAAQIASPRSHIKDNANAIAIDLHRTIIVRSSRSSQPPPFTTIGTEGGSQGVVVSEAPRDFSSLSPKGAKATNEESLCGGFASPSSADRGRGRGAWRGADGIFFGYVNDIASPEAQRFAVEEVKGVSSPTVSLRSGCPVAGGSSASDDVSTPASGSGQGDTPTHVVAAAALSSPLTSPSMLVVNMCEDTLLLKRISELLRTFVEFRPDIGYVQGMSYLAAMILLHIESDVKAFIALASLLSKGHLQQFYTVQHRGIGCHIAVFEAVLQKGLPDLHRHFQRIGVVPQMYVIDWWMSLFSRTLPYEVATRCWDLFLLDEAYLYRISLSLLIYFRNIVHDEAPIDEILMFLSKIQNYSINEDRLFNIVTDSNKYPPSIEWIHKAMNDHLKGL